MLTNLPPISVICFMVGIVIAIVCGAIDPRKSTFLIILALIVFFILAGAYNFGEKVQLDTLRCQLNEPVKSSSQLYGFEVVATEQKNDDYWFDLQAINQPGKPILKNVKVDINVFYDPNVNHLSCPNLLNR